MTTFENTTRLRALEDVPEWLRDRPGLYRHQDLSPHLYVFSRFLQTLFSQAGTLLFTGETHTTEPGIHKTEGGIKIYGVGDVVLGRDSCSFDYSEMYPEKCATLARLISRVVIEFQPMDPLASMVKAATKFLFEEKPDLGTPEQIEGKLIAACTRKNGMISFLQADSLYDFFRDLHDVGDRQGFLRSIRPYRRHVRLEIAKEKLEDIERDFADQDLGWKLEEQFRQRLKGTRHYMFAVAPRRRDGKLTFWVNSTIGYGTVTEAQIHKLLALPNERLTRLGQDSLDNLREFQEPQ